MRVRVDPGLCQGHNRCVAAAPDLFDLDDEGFASAANGGMVPAGQEDLAQLAVDNCPEGAISLDSAAQDSAAQDSAAQDSAAQAGPPRMG